MPPSACVITLCTRAFLGVSQAFAVSAESHCSMPSHSKSKGKREPSPRRQTSQKTSPKRSSIPGARPRKVVPPPVPEEEVPQRREAEEHADPRRAKEESWHAFSPTRLPRMEGTRKDHAPLSHASSHASIHSLTPATSSKSERSGRGSSFFRPVKAQDLNSEAGKGTLVMLSPEKLTRPPHHTKPRGRPVSPAASDDYLRSFTSRSSKASTSSSHPLTKEEFEDEDFDPRSHRGRTKRKQEPSPGTQSSRNAFPERSYVPSDQPRKVVPPPLPTEETLERREAEEDTGPKRAREESRSPSSPKKLPHMEGTEVPSKAKATSSKKRASKRSLEPSARGRRSTASQLPLGADSDPDTVPAPAPVHHSRSGASRRKQDKSTVKRYPQGYRVLREIRRLQRTTHLLLPRLPFSRVVRDTLWKVSSPGMRMSLLAIQALQEAAEVHLVNVMDGAYTCARHANRKTLMSKDLAFFLQLRKQHFGWDI